MLIITRRPGEKIMLGEEVSIQVMEIVGAAKLARAGAPINDEALAAMGNQLRIGIQAPKSVPVYREEIWEAVKAENQAAADTAPDELP